MAWESLLNHLFCCCIWNIANQGYVVGIANGRNSFANSILSCDAYHLAELNSQILVYGSPGSRTPNNAFAKSYAVLAAVVSPIVFVPTPYYSLVFIT